MASRSRLARRIVAIIVAGPLLGLALAMWVDWNSRGGYEPVGYYLANSWNSWRVPTETSPHPASVATLRHQPHQITAKLNSPEQLP